MTESDIETAARIAVAAIQDDESSEVLWAQNLIDAIAAALAAKEGEIQRLREALGVIADCPPTAVHLMPLAAQAALSGANRPAAQEQTNG